uniref:Mu-like prophage protein gp16 n=1 Tax=Candidatus Kentrum sp. UNK TaxID=2126344 RepID=A0A450ZWQ2_9GAMM|nr:MAG: Mu-like prophage protein gp16 [Candidatus Kentron sp. UNK]VFK68328.1 MAG: Mu-like prophage protein gp16 [Candidatus Kentron sp. UNK]
MNAERKNAIAKIHIGKKQLGMEEDAYREMLRNATGKGSVADMDDDEVKKVLARLRRNGARFHRKHLTAAEGKKPLIDKVFALLGDRTPAYAEGILKQMHGDLAPERLEWATPEQLRAVISALANNNARREKTKAKTDVAPNAADK